jgi:hypothetical protein
MNVVRIWCGAISVVLLGCGGPVVSEEVTADPIVEGQTQEGNAVSTQSLTSSTNITHSTNSEKYYLEVTLSNGTSWNTGQGTTAFGYRFLVPYSWCARYSYYTKGGSYVNTRTRGAGWHTVNSSYDYRVALYSC